MSAGPKDEKRIFATAMALKTAAERQAYLEEACGSDAALRARLTALLGAREDRSDFLDQFLSAPDAALHDSIEAPGTVVDRYKLLERIGEGGMAVVYMAEQQQPIRRKVALKIIKLGMDTKQVIARFEAERQALAMMDHPNIAKVLDAGATETGRPYFVMELVQGVSVTEYCDKNNLSTKERLGLFIQVCHAVQHAHQKGIIHRDIKPSNVMVTRRDGTPVPKVIDFGIAKATNQKLTEKTLFTRYAHIIGTPAYMSPEQAELSDLDIDTRSDIYSLGVLLYELLTGTTPFSEEELRKAGYLEMQRIIREQEPSKPSTKLSTLGETSTDIAKHRGCTPDLLVRAVRGDLDWIVMKCLEKDRVRRYDTVSILLGDIQRHLRHEPVSAGPPTALYRMRKFVRRHRIGLMAGTVVVAATFLGLVINITLYKRLEEASVDRRISVIQRLYAEGRYQAALAEMENQELDKAKDTKARLLYARILSDVGRREEAEVHLQGLVEAEPETAGAAHYLLARLYLGNAPKESQEHRLRAEQILPRTADGYALRALTAATPDEALKWLNDGLRLFPSHYASRKARALVHHGLRDHASMLRDAETMIAMRPQDSMSYALRALAQREVGQLKEALLDHNQAIEVCDIEAELPILYEQRQETFWLLGNYSAALQDARRCVDLAPNRLGYRVPLARALFKLEQYEAAKQEFTRLRADQGALWQAVRTMVQYTLDTARAGDALHIPDSLAAVWPFLHLPKYVDLNTQLEQKGVRLVAGSLDLSSWSPDGAQLAYGRSELCTWGDNTLQGRGIGSPVVARGIEILDLASGRTRTLVAWGGGPAWSPDGHFIAFVRARDMTTENEAEVWLVPAGGGTPKRLAQGAYPSWTSDAAHLYFHSRARSAVCCVDITKPAGEPVEVATCPGLYPAVSPDERYLAYATGGELTVVDLGSGEKLIKWVVPGPEKYCCVRWSPDGKEISLGVLGTRSYCSGLWVFDFEHKQGWHLLDTEAICCNWSSDRSRVALDVFFPVSEIWMAEVDPNVPTWKTLAPAQSRGEYIRSEWPKYVASYVRAWHMEEKGIWHMEKEGILKNLIAVGVNQYEYGEYEDALWTLQRVAELRQSQGVGPDVETDAHIVMTLHQIGRREEAAEALRELRRIYKRAEDAHHVRYLHKVEQCLAGDNSEAY